MFERGVDSFIGRRAGLDFAKFCARLMEAREAGRRVHRHVREVPDEKVLFEFDSR